MLDGITRLGSLYVQICNSGCTLFQNWKAVFFCNPERPLLTVVEFGKDGKHKVCQNVFARVAIEVSVSYFILPKPPSKALLAFSEMVHEIQTSHTF